MVHVDLGGATRVVLGLATVCFAPGWAWTRALFPHSRGLERFVLSLALAIGMMTAALYVLGYVGGVRINGMNTIWIAISLTLIGGVLGLRRKSPAAAALEDPRRS